MRKIFSLILIILFVFSMSLPAIAATDTWIGDTSAEVSDAANWSSPPALDDDLVFNAAGSFNPPGTSLTDSVAAEFTNITFNGPDAFTITGTPSSTTLTLIGEIDNDSSVTQTFGMDMGGIIINNGIGTGTTLIAGTVDSSVAWIEESSVTSPLEIDGAIALSGTGTTSFTVDIGANTLLVTGGVTGTGDIALYNDSDSNNLNFTTSDLNNSGTITNEGSGTGTTYISGGIGSNLGSNVTQIIEASTSSGLIIDTNPVYVNSTSGTTIAVNSTPGADGLIVNSDILGTGDLVLENNTNTADALYIAGSINNTGTVTNQGSGNGEVLVDGGVGSNVTGIIQNSASSQLTFDTTAISINSGGSTALTDMAGTLQVNFGVTGTGDLYLYNDSTTANGIQFTTQKINNTGNIWNEGSSGVGGSVEISGGVGPNVTGIIENSTTSALTIDTDPITIGSTTTLTNENPGGTSILHVTGGVGGTGNLVLNNSSNISGGITLSGDEINNTGSITNNGSAGTTVISGEIGPLVTNVIEDGASPLVLGTINSYSGATTITSGTLQTASGGAIPSTSDVSIASGGTLDLDGISQTIGSLSDSISSGSGVVLDSSVTAATLTTGADNNSTTFSGTIENNTGVVSLIKEGTGTLILSGDNHYSGGTTINGGTLTVGNAGALGTGFVTNSAGATLNLGSTSLNIGSGMYTQAATSNLKLTVASTSTFGSIASTVAASVASGSFINVTVANGAYIPNGTQLEIINTSGAGMPTEPLTANISTSNSSFTTFTDSIIGNNLYLIADTVGGNFASLANNANAKQAATALDKIINPGSDMTNILTSLGSLSNSQVAAALNTLGPIVDQGIVENSTASLNNFIGATLDRIQNALDHGAPATGFSSGDDITPNGVWAKQYGSYLDQNTRDSIQGYNAWNTGTAVGIDHLFNDDLTLGVSGGYAYGQTNSDINNGNIVINSAQGTLYGGYQDPNIPYYVDLAGSYAWNWYTGKRDITIGTMDRVADSDFDGQQYGAYFEGGYKVDLGNSLLFTPLASVQWNHLDIAKYTETDANSLDLAVSKQEYNILESGLGASVSYPIQLDWGNFTPELHAKWLYDFIDDPMVVTSAFSGGGGSFTSTGATPAKNGADLGTKLTFDLKDNLSLIGVFDAELKNEFYSLSGSLSVRYKF